MRYAVLVALLPVAASAQVSLSNDVSGTSPLYIGRAACKSKVINFSWNVGTNHPGAGETVHSMLAQTSSGCSNVTAASGDVRDKSPAPTQTQTGVDQRKASDLILDADAGLPGGCDNTARSSTSPYTVHYCIQLQTAASTISSFAEIPVNFAMKNPTAPTDLSIEPGDQHLKLSWSPGDSAEQIKYYDVHVLAADAGYDPGKRADRVTTQTSSDVKQTDDQQALINDQTYSVFVVATDLYENVSDPSDAGTGTPIQISDFYDEYRDKGGKDLGGRGCSSAGAGTWMAALAIAAGLFARRRRKLRNGAMLLLGVALLAPAAQAQWHAPAQSPRRILVAFKLDRYDPQIDSEAAFAALPTNQRPYHTIFHGRAPLRYQLELDWEIAHPFGTILVGATGGYWQNIGKGINTRTGQQSGDTALLDIIPLGLVATYRFDWLADRWARFPVIPYAQAGLMNALWISFSGNGNVSKDRTGGGRGSGWTHGYTTALGIAVNLNAIDPDLAREAYVDTGLQRSSLFAEYGWTRLDNFRGGDSMILSDRAWRFGLALEF